jgi:hypothetical protein
MSQSSNLTIHPSKVVDILIKPDNKIRARNLVRIQKGQTDNFVELAILVESDHTRDNSFMGPYPPLEHLRYSAFTVVTASVVEFILTGQQLTVGIPATPWTFQPTAALLNNREFDEYLTKVECGVIYYEFPEHLWELILGQETIKSYGYSLDAMQVSGMSLYCDTVGHSGQYPTFATYFVRSKNSFLAKRCSSFGLFDLSELSLDDPKDILANVVDSIRKERSKNSFSWNDFDEPPMDNPKNTLASVVDSICKERTHHEKSAVYEFLSHLVAQKQEEDITIDGRNLLQLHPTHFRL